ncbi:SdpI family protein [Nonomuraea terrae]|uniref:SdpI family protein n=1 Tax=Nonomuraea terrae TaxID=2530383 RepID=UPI0037B3C0A7
MELMPFLLGFAGLLALVVGHLGRVERLPRNSVAGVRTPASMRSDAAFRAANKAAGVPTMIAGALCVAGGVGVWLVPDAGVPVIAVTVVALLAFVVAGGVKGSRAANAVNDQEPG